MKKFLCVVLLIIFIITIIFSATPYGRALWNNWWHDIQRVDDLTNYETRKDVEDTRRPMISSYYADRLVYEQYKDSDNEEKQSWAEQAKMRANKTAIEYNNYILKNKYVFGGNVPIDIRHELEILG